MKNVVVNRIVYHHYQSTLVQGNVEENSQEMAFESYRYQVYNWNGGDAKEAVKKDRARTCDPRQTTRGNFLKFVVVD